MKKIITGLLFSVFTVAVFLLSSCSGDSQEPISVSSLGVTTIVENSATSTSTTAPVSYDVTISWNTSAIMADENASTAFSGVI